MASSYTQSDSFEKMATGDQPNNWGATLDNTLDLIDQAADGTVSISLNALSTYVLITTAGLLSNGRCRSIVFTGTPTGTVAVTLPAVPKWYFIQNLSTQSLVFSCGAGTTYTLPTSMQAVILCDGTNVSSAIGSLSIASLIVSGSITAGGSITGSKLISSGSSASCALGAGAGTGAVLNSFAGNDIRGVVNITAGAAGTAFSPIVTVTYSAAFPAAAVVLLSNYQSTICFVSGNNAAKFDIIFNAALVNGQAYQFAYMAIG